jgi:hypothetical protein
MSRRWRLRRLGLWLLLLPRRLLLLLLLLLLGRHCCRLGAGRRGRRRRSVCVLLLRVPPSSLVLRRRRSGAGRLCAGSAPGCRRTANSGLGNQHGGLEKRFLFKELHPLSLVLDRHTQRDVLQAGGGGPQVSVHAGGR